MSTTLKPIRGIRINKSHLLARGLVGCWLFNEGTGGKIYDLSGNGDVGTLQGNAYFTSGKFGSALEFDGTGDYVDCGNGAGNVTDGMTWAFWVNMNDMSGSQDQQFLSKYTASGTNRAYRIATSIADNKILRFAASEDGTAGTVSSNDWSNFFSFGEWIFVAITKQGSTLSAYKNGAYVSSKTDIIWTGAVTSFKIGGTTTYFNGLIDHVMIFSRALSASEIALLYREPFCMFDRAWRPGLIGGQIVELMGTSDALSSLSATAKATRKVGGTVASTSDVAAVLNSIRGLAASTGGLAAVDGSISITAESSLEVERGWIREALFNGMTANAFKLGTSLSLGWFWVRVAGCSVLYRGSGMEEIDFTNILTVSEQGACEISPPSYIPHNNNSTCFYVVRRFNQCGDQEHTLAAAAKLSIDANGGLAEPQPNNVFSSRVEPVNGNKIRLTWFYSTLEQQSAPMCFNIYYDNLSGQIDYENPIATVRYEGRKFYCYESDPLTAGRYLFAIRAKDVDGTENSSPALLRIHLQAGNPDAIDVLSIEAV